MAQQAKRRLTRAARTIDKGTTALGADTGLISHVERLVAENTLLKSAVEALRVENTHLKGLIVGIEGALGVGSRKARASASSVVLPLRSAKGRPLRNSRPAVRPTDPAVLKKRQASLKKARQALADKRAAAKSA